MIDDDGRAPGDDARGWLRTAVEAAGVGIWRADLANGMGTRDETMSELLGLEHSSAMEPLATVLKRVHPDDGARLAEQLARSRRAGARFALECRVCLPDDSTRWLLVQGNALEDVEGFIGGIALDVTETRRRALDALATEERVRLSLVASDIGTYFSDLREGPGAPDAHVQRLLGLAFDEGLRDEDEEAPPASGIQTGQVEREFQQEYRVVRGDGSVHWLLDKGKVIRRADGGPSYVAGALVDITQRKERERAQEEAGRAAVEASRAKDELLAMIGHELRSPLSPIFAALETMRMRGACAPEQKVLERQVAHLARLVGDLMDAARITQGKVELRRKPMELYDVVMDALECAGPQLGEGNHQVKVEVPRYGLRVEMDPDRMTQVVSNLVTNAAKYSDAGSCIHVRAAEVGSTARLRVSDEGMGVEASMLSRIFEPFVQEPAGARRSRGGLGLGLTIVKNLVELHGGRVWAESEGAGKGTDVVLELPRLPASGVFDLSGAPENEEPPAVPMPLCSRMGCVHARILIVDDNVDGADLARGALEMLGHEVTVAYDAASALALARTFRPAVAFVDIDLPEMSGYELARRLREEAGDDVPFHLVALTGHGFAEDRRRAEAAGFERHLVKPVGIERLESVVRELEAG